MERSRREREINIEISPLVIFSMFAVLLDAFLRLLQIWIPTSACLHRPKVIRGGSDFRWHRLPELPPAAVAADDVHSIQHAEQIRQNVARFRLYRHRFLQVNMRFTAFFKIYQIIKLNFFKFGKFLQISRHLQIFCCIFTKIADFSNRFFAIILRLQRCKRMQIL